MPIGETAPSNENVCYIEAIAGERFEIMIRYLPGYRVDRAASLVYELSLDGTTFTFSPVRCKDLVTQNGTLVYPEEHVCDSNYLNVTKHLAKVSYYCFGTLEVGKWRVSPASASHDY